MGNAFTFELETLIFWALSQACTENSKVHSGVVKVYGDDIIVHRDVYDDLVYVLNYCGFRVNETKSFRSGPFYESCGRHYFNCFDVTPVYQKKMVNSSEECIRFHNRLVKWGVRIYGDPWYFDEALMLLQAMYYDHSNTFMQNKELPRVSLISESDDGFISPDDLLHLDENRGYFSLTLRREKSPLKIRDKTGKFLVKHLNDVAYLQLKLYQPAYSNSDPRGYVYEDSGRGRYRLSRVYNYR
jgi:hypothetical protein